MSQHCQMLSVTVRCLAKHYFITLINAYAPTMSHSETYLIFKIPKADNLNAWETSDYVSEITANIGKTIYFRLLPGLYIGRQRMLQPFRSWASRSSWPMCDLFSSFLHPGLDTLYCRDDISFFPLRVPGESLPCCVVCRIADRMTDPSLSSLDDLFFRRLVRCHGSSLLLLSGKRIRILLRQKLMKIGILFMAVTLVLHDSAT